MYKVLIFPARTLSKRKKKNDENVKDSKDGKACLNNRISPALSRN